MILTKKDVSEAVERLGKRGAVRAGLNAVEVRVPVWRVSGVRRHLRDAMPITVAVSVRPLSLVQHITTRGVTVLADE